MKKFSAWFSGRKLHRWTVPVTGIVLLMLTALAWKCVEKSEKAAEARYFYGAYEMVDRCLTAFYNNDPDALLSMYREDYLETVQQRTKQDAETMRASIKKAMADAYAARQASGETYEWTYIGYLRDGGFGDDTGLLAEMGVSLATASRVSRPIEVLLKKTVNGVTTEQVLQFQMMERDERWYTDLPSMPWVGEILFTSGGLQPYQAIHRWVDAWYIGPHDALLKEIPEAVLDAKMGTDRKAWEAALQHYLSTRAEEARQKGTVYTCRFSTREDLTAQDLQTLKQAYRDTCGLEVADAMSIRYTVWTKTPPVVEGGEPSVHWDDATCTMVKIDGQWYIDSLNLPTMFGKLWKITPSAP